MCGILAYFGDNLSKNKLDESLALMNHRGPDFKDSICYNNSIYLGHNRLSIIDLDERSNQPFVSEDLTIIYNGEVYNYIELIKEHNLKVKTSSDTEVVLEMYKKYGSDCLKYFNGMFAFVIYNKTSEDVFVARDRLGIKPLFISQNNSEMIIASEIAPILNVFPSEIDEFGLRQYRKLRMTIKGYTVYENIKTFPPGHYYLNGKIIQYWDLEMEQKDPPTDEELAFLISDAVALRKRSDVPVGSYLSGGLDSTILTYLLKPNDTWTVGFELLNEFGWSDIADSNIQSDHHKILIDNDEFLELAKWMVHKRKEPLSVPNEVLIYLMTKKVKERNTVILSGEGADELFMGYDRIFRWANSKNEIQLAEFDEKYCYGSNKDDEVLDFALENINGKRVIDKIAYYFQIIHLQGLLRRLDNSTMLCSVEARVPFVDHRLVERLAGVSFNWKMGDSFKEPLKRVFGTLIPKEIINRKKVGFPVPLDKVFENYLPSEQITPMDKWLLFNKKYFLDSLNQS
jgi:asparagine synthase (glutamine-hydrolysing)